MGSGLEAGQNLSENGRTPPWLSGLRLTLGGAWRVSRKGQTEPGIGLLDCRSAVRVITGKLLRPANPRFFICKGPCWWGVSMTITSSGKRSPKGQFPPFDTLIIPWTWSFSAAWLNIHTRGIIWLALESPICKFQEGRDCAFFFSHRSAPNSQHNTQHVVSFKLTRVDDWIND